MQEPYPYPIGMGDILLPYPEHENAPPIIVATPVLNPFSEYHLFVASDRLKPMLNSIALRYSREYPTVSHTALEVRAAWATITVYERRVHAGELTPDSPVLVYSDTWNQLYYACVELFEYNQGWIAKYDSNGNHGPKMHREDVHQTAPPDGPVTTYETPDGLVILEYCHPG